MVLVALKNLLTGGPDKPLLPTNSTANGNYRSLDDSNSDESAVSKSSSMFAIKEISNPRVVSDIIIGLSDGLTVPFALTAGLSSLGDTKLVITGGLAELVSGAISMGLGGFLAARSESEYYANMLAKEKTAYRETPQLAAHGVQEALSEYNLTPETIKVVISDLEQNENTLATFMVKMVRGIEEPESDRELKSALTIGGSYFLGGFVPLVPYFLVNTVEQGLIFSVVTMAITLLLFGYFKTVLSLGSECTQHQRIVNGFSMLVTGGLAAGAAWLLVKVVDN